MGINPSPIKGSNRLVWIDAARGFAVFGIFIVNIGAFGAPYFLYGGEGEEWNSDMSQAVLVFIDIFFQASFYTLFSMLFGFGFQLMKDRLTMKKVEVRSFLFRRMSILFLFGCIHAFFIWHGDILLSYSLTGFVLLLFLHVKRKTLLIWGLTLLMVGTVLITLSLWSMRDYLGWIDASSIDQAITNYQSNDYGIILGQNYQDWMYSNGGIGIIFSLLFVFLPLFLIGMYGAKTAVFHQPEKYRGILLRVWWISLFVFLGLKLGPYLFGNPLWFSYAQDNIGGAASAVFYVSTITLLAGYSTGSRLIQPFVYVGRMALTNYILQSIVSFILFYGIGFGLYGKTVPILHIGMVLCLFTLQILGSKWWLTKYNFGPLEWVWRSLTYKKSQPLRRSQQQR
ncbi:DUF418 domain-containing protein [Virgibacillus sp. SK37]|uniref:DUF418 domain-containing protein n=1 Tax=Virgibacillus sp. SK37 TaxID=403957 RepID=UPI0004D13C66|nr:DUF418 domain-containing protein [Virgibacillus sp. SK37]AIF42741.1 hypothetical protein X953_05360 [Virgibacillus sp. SK37]